MMAREEVSVPRSFDMDRDVVVLSFDTPHQPSVPHQSYNAGTHIPGLGPLEAEAQSHHQHDDNSASPFGSYSFPQDVEEILFPVQYSAHDFAISEDTIDLGSLDMYILSQMQSSTPDFLDSSIWSFDFSEDYRLSPEATCASLSSPILSQGWTPPSDEDLTEEVHANFHSTGSRHIDKSLLTDDIPRCYQHGCGGRRFSKLANLKRHQQEFERKAAIAACPHCGARFYRKWTRDVHVKRLSCNKAHRHRAVQQDAAQPKRSNTRPYSQLQGVLDFGMPVT